MTLPIRLLLSAVAWAGLWGLGGWYFGRFESGKDFDFFLGIPFMLPTALAAWGTVRGAITYGVGGAIAGTMLGASVGLPGLLVFMCFKYATEGLAFRDVPEWCSVEFIMTSGGLVAGTIVGLLVEWAFQCAPKAGAVPDRT